MELEVGIRVRGQSVDQGAVGARATAARVPWVAPSDTTGDVTGCREGSRHTTPETWATTSTRTPVVTGQPMHHEVSKPSVIEARWSAERIGPTIIAAPHRGHAHVARAGVSLVGATGVSVAVRRRRGCGEERPREGHAGGPAGVREKPGLPDTHEAARENVLDEAPEKLHRGQRHRAALVAVGVVLPRKRHVLAVEGEQPVIADRDAMGVATEVPQDGGRAPEGGLGVHHPVGLEEGVDEGAPRRRVAQVLAAAGQIEFARGRTRGGALRQTSRERPD